MLAKWLVGLRLCFGDAGVVQCPEGPTVTLHMRSNEKDGSQFKVPALDKHGRRVWREQD